MKAVKFLIVALIIISVTGCKNATLKGNTMQEQLKIRFKPSFIPHLDFSIILNEDKGHVLYKEYRPTNMLTGEPKQAILYDSLEFEVKGVDYQKFVETIKEANLENYNSPKMEGFGLDGITTYVEYQLNPTKINKFDFWSPNRNVYVTEYKLLDGFFDFTDKLFEDRKQINYLEDLRGYFDYGLPVRKVADKPLEYRFHSSLSIHEKKDLEDFAKKLPTNEPIIFDCTNAHGMGTVLYPIFRNMIDKNATIYWLLDKEGRMRDQILEIGAKKIYEDKTNILTEINSKH